LKSAADGARDQLLQAGMDGRRSRQIFAALDQSFERREYLAGSAAIHSRLQKLVAGAVRS